MRRRLVLIVACALALGAGLTVPVVALSQSTGRSGIVPCYPWTLTVTIHQPEGILPCPPPTVTTETSTTPPTTTASTPTVTTDEPCVCPLVTVPTGPCGGCPGPPTGTSTTTTPTGTTTPTTTSPTGTTPLPVAGKTSVARVASGVIYYRLRPGGPLIKLTGSTVIPLGAQIDAAHGTLDLTTAGSTGTQTVALTGGTFVAHQSKPAVADIAASGRAAAAASKLTTTLKLAGGNFAVCHPTAHAAGGPIATIAGKKPKKKVVRKLWANEGGGGWSTGGNDASATVEGTWWLTEDTCQGTYVFVKRGVVVVHNKVNHRNVTLRAGHSYLAKGPVPR